jgi:hypothetical protein
LRAQPFSKLSLFGFGLLALLVGEVRGFAGPVGIGLRCLLLRQSGGFGGIRRGPFLRRLQGGLLG